MNALGVPPASASHRIWWPEISPNCSAEDRERCECVWAATFEKVRMTPPAAEEWDVADETRSRLTAWFDPWLRMRPPVPYPLEPAERPRGSTYYRAGD